jgi:hypothetical protein
VRLKTVRKKKARRIYQKKMWEAARLYRKEADKCYKARAYFMAIVARGCELEALLRIFDFVENRRPKDRSYNLNGLIDRAFKRHWIPHDALRHWKKAERIPLKTYLHAIREARNGVHAHLFQKNLVTRRTMANITFVVHAMYSFIETRNARNLMKALHARSEVSDSEYRAWKKEQKKIG